MTTNVNLVKNVNKYLNHYKKNRRERFSTTDIGSETSIEIDKELQVVKIDSGLLYYTSDASLSKTLLSAHSLQNGEKITDINENFFKKVVSETCHST